MSVRVRVKKVLRVLKIFFYNKDNEIKKKKKLGAYKFDRCVKDTFHKTRK